LLTWRRAEGLTHIFILVLHGNLHATSMVTSVEELTAFREKNFERGNLGKVNSS